MADITAFDLQARAKLSEGQFVEMRGTAEPPVVEYWIARVRSLLDFLDRNLKLISPVHQKGTRQASSSLSRQQMALFRDMVNFLEDYTNVSRRDPGKQYIHIFEAGQAYGIWCGLLSEYITVPIQAALPAAVSVVGRVERILGEDEVYRIVDFSRFGQTADMTKLLDALSALGPLIGQTRISEEDLQAQYPDVFVTPLAMYR